MSPLSVSELIGALQREGLTDPMHYGHGHGHRTAARGRERRPGAPLRSRPHPTLRRNPAVISDRLAQLDPSAEIPDERARSAAGWDEGGQWATYRSFHWEPADRWGIYVADDGIWRLADRLRVTGLLPPMRRLDLLRASLDVIVLHEFFHFLTDVASSGLELADPAAARSMYLPYARAAASASPFVGRALEEALANAFVDRRLRPVSLRPAVRAVFDAQPDAYRDFVAYLGRALPAGCRGLAEEIAAGVACDDAGEFDLDLDLRRYGFCDVPVWLVTRLHATPYALAFVDSIDRASLVETDAFRADLRGLPDGVRAGLDAALDRLADTSHPALRFRPVDGDGAVWSIRVGRNHRVTLGHDPPEFQLLGVSRLEPRR